MSLQQLISPDVPILLTADTGFRALAVMEESNMPQLPIVQDEHYLALAQENELMDWKDPQDTLTMGGFVNYKPAIYAGAHPYEAFKLFLQLNLCILPVIDNEYRYIGAITKDTLLKYLSEHSSLGAPGGVIVLEVAQRNYALYEIARICENEDVTITDVQMYPNENGMLEVTLKLNRSELDAVVSSFERHKYTVKEVFGAERSNEDIVSNYNLLMNYINM